MCSVSRSIGDKILKTSSIIFFIINLLAVQRHGLMTSIYKLVLGQDDSVEAKKAGKGPIGWNLGPTKQPGSGTMQRVLFPPQGVHLYFFF
jgi:hypothetical protein